MRVAIASSFACGLSLWSRLQDEGHDVTVFIDRGKGRERNDTHAHVGEGIVALEESWDRFVAWAKERPHETLCLFDSSGMGEKADFLRAQGLLVVGGGSFCDKLETDRQFGQAVAEEAGAKIPPFEAFTSLLAVRKRAQHLDTCVYFKTDRYIDADATKKCENGAELTTFIDELRARGVRDATKCILQEKIDGVALSTARWWNGVAWVGPYEWTIEHKPFMNDDVGPSTGASITVVWFTPTSDVADKLGWEKMATRFRAEQAPPGLYDINAVIDDQGEPYFLEWTPRFGYDSEPVSLRLIDDLGGWLWSVATGGGSANFSDDLGLGIRLSVPPYPWENVEWGDKKTCVGTRIAGVDGLWHGGFLGYEVRVSPGGGYEVASPEGIVGLSYAQGEALSAINEEAVEFAQDMKPSQLQFRTDAAAAIAKDAAILSKVGIAGLHPGLSK